MYAKQDYDVLHARLMNAVAETTVRLEAPGVLDEKAHATASIVRKALAAELSPEDELQGATVGFLLDHGPRPTEAILLFLQDRFVAIWDEGRLLVKPKTVVLPLARIAATVGLGAGEEAELVVLRITAPEALAFALVVEEAGTARLLLELLGTA